MNKILLVDDDKTLLDVLKYNLEKDNYDVITAADGCLRRRAFTIS